MNERTTLGPWVWSLIAAALALCAVLAVPLSAVAPPGAALSTGLVRPATTPTSCPVGSGPGFPGYDPVNHHVYVPNEISGNISVLGGTCTKIGSIHLPSGALPVSAAFDPQNDLMYVTDDGLDQIYTISGLTVTHTITSPLIQAPREALWDPGDALMLVTNDYGNYSVLAITGTSVAGQVGVGSDPQGLCYDPYWNNILVVDYLSQNVTILSAYDPLGPTVGSASVGFDPTSCAYDPATLDDYVVNFGDDNVSVLNGIGAELGSIAVGDLPNGIGFDQAALQLFVGNTLHGGVSVIGTGGTVVKTLNPGAKSSEGIVYDDYNNKMYVTSFSGDDVFVVS